LFGIPLFGPNPRLRFLSPPSLSFSSPVLTFLRPNPAPDGPCSTATLPDPSLKRLPISLLPGWEREEKFKKGRFDQATSMADAASRLPCQVRRWGLPLARQGVSSETSPRWLLLDGPAVVRARCSTAQRGGAHLFVEVRPVGCASLYNIYLDKNKHNFLIHIQIK
jgi:hypothetical protein